MTTKVVFSLISILIILFLLGCEQTKEEPKKAIYADVKPIIIPINKINITIPTIDINRDYRNYYQNFTILYTYGVDKQRMMNIIYTINPTYFKNLREFEVIYSNKDALRIGGTYNGNGKYFPDNYKISLYVYDESDNYVKNLLLHELKHHWCWINKQEVNFDHQGCFLDTPIDEEYGYIK